MHSYGILFCVNKSADQLYFLLTFYPTSTQVLISVYRNRWTDSYMRSGGAAAASDTGQHLTECSYRLLQYCRDTADRTGGSCDTSSVGPGWQGCHCNTARQHCRTDGNQMERKRNEMFQLFRNDGQKNISTNTVRTEND